MALLAQTPDKGYVCTFSALILKQRHAHLLHVGDSRIYLLRNQQLEQLTRDHRVWRGSSSFLSQALGAGAVLAARLSKYSYTARGFISAGDRWFI